MTLETLHDLLFWAIVINSSILITWLAMICLAKDFIYRKHTHWFKISKEHFDAIHYTGLTFYKIMIFIFCVVPYASLIMIGIK